jgi:hypothetical protein
MAWCPQITWSSSNTGTVPSALPGNSFSNYPNQTTIAFTPPTSSTTPTYLLCTASASSSGISITIDPCQQNVTGCVSSTSAAVPALPDHKQQVGKSSGVYLAAVLGVPVLAFFGWFGRNSARKNFFRMMTVLLLAWSALVVSGCSGSYKVTQNTVASPPTVLPVGAYNVLVAVQDSNNNTHYAIVSVNVI